jgi:beta-barrel assembly-enhancing protease
MSKAKGLAWVAAGCGVAVIAAAGLPALARHVPWSVEHWVGSFTSSPVAGSVCTGRGHPESARALNRLVARIYPLDDEDRSLPITVEVVPGTTVNAFATLGGHVYVFDGLLKRARSPDELAGVLAHEIAHVRHRHIIEGAVVNLFTWGALRAAMPNGGPSGSEAAYLLLTLKFSREQEHEADEDGLHRLKQAHVDAAGLAQFFARLEEMPSPPAILSNHPPSEERASRAGTYTGYSTEPALSADDWTSLTQICR